MPSRLLSGILLLSANACLCQPPQQYPILSGYITRVVSLNDFDVNGKSILLGPHTNIQTAEDSPNGLMYETRPIADLKPYLGEPIDIFGDIPAKNHGITANRIILHERGSRPVTGVAIVDAVLPVLPNASASTDRIIRADGYSILITSKTKLSFDKPLASRTDIHVNVWASYHGVQRSDGAVVAEKITFRRNITSRSLDKLREKWEYDPDAIDPATHQDGIDKLVRGIDPKQIPPHKDVAMQARIDSIGAKLVPKYQVDLAYTEDTRIDFRFYLVDMPHWLDAMPLPNGIVLVPYQLVDRLQNDSQLAAILADKVACLLEKQPVLLPLTDADLGIEAAEIAGEFAYAPIGVGIGLVAIPASISAYKQARLNGEQRARVSLSLLRDAGYDVYQAPVAWWSLGSKKPKGISEIPITVHSRYLYAAIGETLPQPTLPTAPAARQ